MLTTNFELDKSDIQARIKQNDTPAFLMRHLQDGYATILIYKSGEDTSHAIVAYNDKGQIYYYDPQKNKHKRMPPDVTCVYFENVKQIRKQFNFTKCNLSHIG